MPPSSGHILVPQAVKVFKHMISRGAAYVRSRLSQEAGAAFETIPIRIAKQPLHPVAALRQNRVQQRNFSTAIRRIIADVVRPVQAARPLAKSTIRSAINKTTHAPFSSPLRPNLTGGTIPRTSGGYSLGGNGIRHFSSTPATQAHVVQNVTAAVRAFCVNGYKAQYDGMDARGLKKYRAVSQAQEKVIKSMHESKPYGKGTTLEFRIAPSITALETEATLESDGLISGLASDFSRSLASLAMVHADLKKLAKLGSLPISYPNPHTLSVRFAGCDAAAVYALCNELSIQRGIVREDPEWDEEEGDKEVGMALLFPWAPSEAPTEELFGPPTARTARDFDWQDMISGSSVHDFSHDGYSTVPVSPRDGFSDLWQLGTQSGSQSGSFDALRDSDIESNEDLGFGMSLTQSETIRAANNSAYEGMEGVLRFLEQCEIPRR